MQPKKIGNTIYVLTNSEASAGRVVGYARASSAEQKPHLQNQANRLWAYAGQKGILLDDVIFRNRQWAERPQAQTAEATG